MSYNPMRYTSHERKQIEATPKRLRGLRHQVASAIDGMMGVLLEDADFDPRPTEIDQVDDPLPTADEADEDFPDF